MKTYLAAAALRGRLVGIQLNACIAKVIVHIRICLLIHHQNTQMINEKHQWNGMPAVARSWQWSGRPARR
jgi:hypothetical protein